VADDELGRCAAHGLRAGCVYLCDGQWHEDRWTPTLRSVGEPRASARALLGFTAPSDAVGVFCAGELSAGSFSHVVMRDSSEQHRGSKDTPVVWMLRRAVGLASRALLPSLLPSLPSGPWGVALRFVALRFVPTGPGNGLR